MSLRLERARQLLSAFHDKKILVVGDFFLDSYVQGEIERLNPESHLVHLLRVGDTRSIVYRSGGAGNVARNIASLGGDALLISVCGKDARSRRVKKIATKEKYQGHYIIDPCRNTIEKRRYVTKDGVLLRVDFEDERSVKPIGEEVTKEVLDLVKGSLYATDAVLVSDYSKGLLTKALCDQMLDCINERGIPVMADVKPAQIGHFTGVDMIAPNLKEASESIGNSNMSIESITEALAKRINTEAFLTAGSEGICIAKKNTETRMVKQAHLVKVGDTSGCGDTAVATILLAKLAGATSEEAAELANAAAAVTVSMVGAYAPIPAEVLRMLAS